jgi:hypothetical protein
MDSVRDIQRAHGQVRSKGGGLGSLVHLYQCKEIQKLVSCDGHRLLATTTGYKENHAGKLIRSDVFVKDFDFIPVDDFKYPNVMQLLPVASRVKREIQVYVPLWIKGLEKKNPTGKNSAGVSLVVDDSGVYFVLGNHPRAIAGFNAAYLSTFADQDIVLGITDENSPIIIIPAGSGAINEYRSRDWFMILMPMRLEKVGKPLAFEREVTKLSVAPLGEVVA